MWNCMNTGIYFPPPPFPPNRDSKVVNFWAFPYSVSMQGSTIACAFKHPPHPLTYTQSMRGTVSTLNSAFSNPLQHTMLVTMGTTQDVGRQRSILPYPSVRATLQFHKAAKTGLHETSSLRFKPVFLSRFSVILPSFIPFWRVPSLNVEYRLSRFCYQLIM